MTAPVETIFFDVIDSTNAEARRRADAGQTGPVWLAASRQTAGKGRRGRVWESPAGNLAATLLITLDRPAADAAQISFVAALATADAVSTLVDTALIRVKWPNDVMAGDKKIAGILIESGKAAAGLWLAVGIGVNIAHPPEQSERPATCIAELTGEAAPEMHAVLEELAGLFDHWLGIWERMGFAPIADAWTERAYGLGQTCEARLPGETVTGVAEGIDGEGALRLRLADGSVRRITAGDVFFGET